MNQCVLFSKGGSLLKLGFRNYVVVVAESFALMCVRVVATITKSFALVCVYVRMHVCVREHVFVTL